MDFGLSEDQSLFADALEGYLGEAVPMTRVREVMATETAHDEALLRGLSEQGVSGILVPAEHGGSGLGLLDAFVAAQALGSAAAPCNFHTSGVMAPLALGLAGDQSALLERVASGDALVTFAEGAELGSDGKLTGECPVVPDAMVADAIVVAAARASGDRCLVLVEGGAQGVTREALVTVDETRRIGAVAFASTPAAVLSEEDAEIERVLDAGRIALAADAFGAATRSLDEAVRYAQDRKQFGRVIASFQSIKHICAETYAELEPLRALGWYAAFAWDEQREDAALVAALLQSETAEAATRAVTQAVQVFGGMGFTHECDVHIWFKRVGYDRQMCGGPVEARRRAASVALA